MKVVVSCVGSKLEDPMDLRFGRASAFLIVDSETLSFVVVGNNAVHMSGGAGIASAQRMIDQKVDAVITGQLGPNAFNVLNSAGIPSYKGMVGTVYENMVALKQKKLSRIEGSGPSHVGIGRGNA